MADHETPEVVHSWLGARAHDRATMFKGVITGVAFYVGASPQVRIEAETPTGDAKERWVPAGRVDLADQSVRSTIGFHGG